MKKHARTHAVSILRGEYTTYPRGDHHEYTYYRCTGVLSDVAGGGELAFGRPGAFDPYGDGSVWSGKMSLRDTVLSSKGGGRNFHLRVACKIR
jgi:hypothetical protein